MSIVEADLEDDAGLQPESYLDALAARAPSAVSLLNDVRRLQIFKGFIVFVPPGNAADGVLLSKAEVQLMLDINVVEWERLHTDLIAAVYDHRASSKHNAAAKSKKYIDRRFQLFHALAREHPPFLASASQHQQAMWTSGIDALAADFARLFEERLMKGGIFPRQSTIFWTATGSHRRVIMKKQCITLPAMSCGV